MTLGTNGPTGTAGADGTFRVPDALLVPGANSLTLRAVDLAGNASPAATRSITRTEPQDPAQVALDWTAAMLDAVRVSGEAPPLASRNMAMVASAMYDAVNAVNGASSFLYARVPSPGACPGAYLPVSTPRATGL